MGVRVLAALGVVAAGLGGCAAEKDWSQTPVNDAGPVGEQASRLARLRAEWAMQNLANVDTPGFRATRIVGPDLTGNGLITRVDQSQGIPHSSNSPLDLMVSGPGFFRLAGDDGYVYTRCGRFTRNADGEIVWAIDPSLRLEPPIAVPETATSIFVDQCGVVSCATADSPGVSTELGRVQLTTFRAPERLLGRGVLFWETATSGPAIDFDPSMEVSVVQGMYEGSNVDPQEERVDIERARRVMRIWAFEPASQETAVRLFSANERAGHEVR
ncbi:MAG: hypothetical protein QM783_11685 [Phycisphaerales bacterium]